MQHPLVPFKVYRNVILSLFALTFLTVIVAPSVSGIDAGPFNAVIAMGIATGKAYLVAMYFMGLKYEDWVNRSIFLASIAFLFVLFLISWIDIISRIAVESTL